MADMRTYLVSLGAGLLVGVVYSLLNVRSPAPPVVALVGLLGMLIGEEYRKFKRLFPPPAPPGTARPEAWGRAAAAAGAAQAKEALRSCLSCTECPSSFVIA